MSTSKNHWAIEAFYLKDKDGRLFGRKLYDSLATAIRWAAADHHIVMVPSERALRTGLVVNTSLRDLFVVHSVSYHGWIQNILIATPNMDEAKRVLAGESDRKYQWGPPMLRAVPISCIRLNGDGEQEKLLQSLRCGKYAKVSR